MKIIGHRGAAGVALENTLDSFKAAQKLQVDAIELDVRKTMDGQLVVCHNPDTSVVAKQKVQISLATYAALHQITLNDGKSTVPKLSDALKTIKNTPVIIEIKDEGCTAKLSDIIASQKRGKYMVASFKINELVIFKKLQPNIKTFGLTYHRPLKLINSAHRLGLSGIGLSFWGLNPLVYRLVKKQHLEIYVYTINSKPVAKLIKYLYPGVDICTDRPDKLIALRDKISNI